MSKRLQVLLDERDYALLKKASQQQKTTTAEWVRRALRAAVRQQPLGDERKKLAAIRRAVKHAFPAPDIDQMLEEIERNYR